MYSYKEKKYNNLVVEGNDGTGKTTLVGFLRNLGFENVFDRGELTQATDDSKVIPKNNSLYVLLTCSPETSRRRLLGRGADMNDEYHSMKSLSLYHDVFLSRARISSFKEQTIIINNEHLTPEKQLKFLLTKLGKTVKIGFPNGRLKGIDPYKVFGIEKPNWTERTLVIKQNPYIFTKIRSKTYPQMIALGELDVAFVGSDVLEGNVYKPNLRIINSWKQPNVKMVVAGKTTKLPAKTLLRVATPFPNWAQQYFGELGIPHTIYSVSGGTEALVAHDIADVIFDVVETGNTLKANGLQVINDISDLKICLVGAKHD